MMKTVCEINQCTGCMACFEICPRKAIQLRDSLKFYNAVIDPGRCISCSLCHDICPVSKPPSLTAPFLWKQGWASDSLIRKRSSSGGLAAAIEASFLENEGVVYSCFFLNGEFRFGKAETVDEIQQFTGSKYVKSNPGGIYTDILGCLDRGKKVLFVGLPCQAAAVRKYTHGHENLYTIDLICHGTPSPALLDMFLRDYGLSLKEIDSISFRRKNHFWLTINNRAVAAAGVWDAYTMTFCDAVTYTESCYSCKFAGLKRPSDLTLGDSWGSDLSDSERKAGISLLLCQTQKGEALLSMADLHLENVSLKRAILYNHHLQHAAVPHRRRKAFFRAVRDTGSFRKAAWKCFPVKLFKKSVKAFLLKPVWSVKK